MSTNTQYNLQPQTNAKLESWHGELVDESLSPPLPGASLIHSLRKGDQLIRSAAYDGVEQSAVIVSEQIESSADLAARGVPIESSRPGGYVEVMEECSSGELQSVGRRLTDTSGQLLRGQKLIRPENSDLDHLVLEEYENIYDEDIQPNKLVDNYQASEVSTNQINWCQMRQTIAATARAEEARWTASNDVKYQEGNHPDRNQILQSYWLAVPGFSSRAAAAVAATQSINNQVAWSAAFISYIMRAAGIRQENGFQFGRRHLTYIVAALRNRERSATDAPFWLVDETELANEAIPQPGDIICFNRSVNGRMTNHSYGSLRTSYWSNGRQNATAYGSSHSSIVVGTTTQGGQRMLETIGGNEDHSVRIRHILLNQRGGIASPSADNIFGMIKITKC